VKGSAEPIVRVRDLTTSFPAEGGRVRVVDGVSLEVAAGETVALVGESGCGKSMTALSMMRLVPRPGRIEGGEIRVGDREISGLGVKEMREIRGGTISMIFQEPMTSLNPVQKCGPQVAEAFLLHHRESKAAARRRVIELFAQVGIPDPEARFSAYPHQLSGGLRQRVMIAMALVSRPRLLIADEPTTALDVTIQAQILELLRSLQRELGMAILLITHDVGVVNELADRVVVMYAGRIAEEGERRRVLGSPGHPYTQGLLQSLPGAASRGRRLQEIPGAVPAAAHWGRGCRFANRCPVAIPSCSLEEPAARAIAPGHAVWCPVGGEGG
jgi:oligopeptide/dipeptide ABC transporter ATP-binding protein